MSALCEQPLREITVHSEVKYIYMVNKINNKYLAIIKYVNFFSQCTSHTNYTGSTMLEYFMKSNCKQ